VQAGYTAQPTNQDMRPMCSNEATYQAGSAVNLLVIVLDLVRPPHARRMAAAESGRALTPPPPPPGPPDRAAG
jgi:hypothetical protein